MRTLLFLLPTFLLLSLATAAELDPIGWGVVSSPSPDVYDKTGKRLAEIKGGELFTILKEVSVNKAPAYYIELRRPKKPRCILPGGDCKVFLELPDASDPDAVAGVKRIQTLLADYYSTLALRETLLDRAEARHRAGTPAEKLEKLRDELRGVPARDRALEAAQAKAASNAERLRYQDARKELRYRTTGLQEEIRRTEAAAAEWERTHPFNPDAVRKSAVWKKLTQRLRTLEEQVTLFGVTPAKD